MSESRRPPNDGIGALHAAERRNVPMTPEVEAELKARHTRRRAQALAASQHYERLAQERKTMLEQQAQAAEMALAADRARIKEAQANISQPEPEPQPEPPKKVGRAARVWNWLED